MFISAFRRITAISVLCISTAAWGQSNDVKTLERDFAPAIQPLVQRYCYECHSGERIEGELDLAMFADWNAVRQHPQVWQKIREMLDSEQMPPSDAPQPNEAEFVRLRSWVRDFLTIEAAARAGDPGRVVLRRLNNAEYTFTLRDLTRIESLNPAYEFPVDGAAGEGFTNTGAALAMSPALVTKYLDAAKEVAGHAVLLPDGFRFSPHTTRADWTNEALARLRTFYGQFTDARRGDRVNLQGIMFDTNEGGRLPLEKYFVATLKERAALLSGEMTVDQAAARHQLNAKYLGLLWKVLTEDQPSLLLGNLQAHWKAARPEDAGALVAEVAAWQNGLWKFSTVGHIGKAGGPKRWLEPVDPLATQQDFRVKAPEATAGNDVIFSLVATSAGDGATGDVVVWRQPRLVAPGRPDLLLRDVRRVAADLAARRTRVFSRTANYLRAADEAATAGGAIDVADLAKKHQVEPTDLQAWLDFLGVGPGPVALTGHFTNQIANANGYDFIQGWGSHDTPLLLANASDQHVRIPGNMSPRSVAVHPSPSLRAAVGWRSPVTAPLRVEATVAHAHPECGNGVTWTLELRRGATRQRLAAGIAQGASRAQIGPIDDLAVRKGDVVSLIIGPRDNNHSCDLTTIELRLTAREGEARTWDLAKDISGTVLEGNPHADSLGNRDVWHFYTEPNEGAETGPVIPAGSLLAKWQTAQSPDEKNRLADAVQALLTQGPPETKDSPDAALYRQLASLGGPLFAGALEAPGANTAAVDEGDHAVGLDPALFGKHPQGHALDAASLCVQAPATLEIRLPADLAAGCELVTTGALDETAGAEGSVQLAVVAGPSNAAQGLLPSQAQVQNTGSNWTDPNRKVSLASPMIVREGSETRKRFQAALEEFRQLFPAALCYTKIVPVDEVVTLTLFYREDDHLARLMLDETQQAHLNRLWDELHFISHDALTQLDAFAQLMEYATQDGDPSLFEPLRAPMESRATSFRQQLSDAEPKQIESLIAFAGQAYRRPLTDDEATDLRTLYHSLRQQELPHEEAFRLTLARVLVSPAFLYRAETPGPGAGQGPVSDWELATRLSYFLWSSQPDDELRRVAAEGRLRDTEVLLAQTRRMLRDAKTRRLATEFACQWLQIYEFNGLDEKSDRHFPTFLGLRDSMYEESIQFFTSLFQNNGSVLDILDADYTFLNEDLAKHYAIPGVSGPEWRRVEGVRQYSRGGILAQATTLSKQSGASRTSPILRGNWVSEVLLGERLPRPPKGIPPLPDDEAATEGLTVRELVEKHSSDAKCAVCHRRIDPFGFSLEAYDAIGRWREKDLGDRPIDTKVTAMDGSQFEGLGGLRDYLLTTRRDAFLRQFCRKLLGYALGRSVQLSDEPLLAEMRTALEAQNFSAITAVETIVQSRQFREIRGQDVAQDE